MKFEVAIWDGEDYIVTARPDTEPVWKAVPIGGILTKNDANIIATWLPSALNDLSVLFKNMSSEDN